MMGDCLGTLGGADKIKTKLGSVAGACQSIRWMANSFKAFKLWESRDCVWDSLLATAYGQSPWYWPFSRVQPLGAMKKPNLVNKEQLQNIKKLWHDLFNGGMVSTA